MQPSSIADKEPRQTPPVREPRLRVVEAVGALSLITDLGLGQPLEHALRSSVIAVRFGQGLGLRDRDLSDAFFVTLLRFVGCTAAAHEMAEVLGDEMPEAVRRNVGVGEPPTRREQIIGDVMQGLFRPG